MEIDLQEYEKINKLIYEVYLPNAILILNKMSTNIDDSYPKSVQNKATKLLKKYNRLKDV